MKKYKATKGILRVFSKWQPKIRIKLIDAIKSNNVARANDLINRLNYLSGTLHATNIANGMPETKPFTDFTYDQVFKSALSKGLLK